MGRPVDILAPGGDFGYPSALGGASLILSSFKGSNAAYAFLAGTSMAAPHVAGVFAAIKSKPSCANKTVTQIENAMKATGRSITDTRSGGTHTRKRVDVGATIAALCP
jgi:subtilisin family serine protease